MTLPRMIPKKPKRENRLRSPGHLAWVRKHECCVAMPGFCDGQVVAAHVRIGTDGGISLKPGDEWTISLCDYHHKVQHAIGEQSFEKRYGIDMKALAKEFAAKSPALRRKRGNKAIEAAREEMGKT